MTSYPTARLSRRLADTLQTTAAMDPPSRLLQHASGYLGGHMALDQRSPQG